MDNKEFKPFIPADKVMPELTVTSIVLGLILSVVFGAANAYLGLRVGMTISASIPAAVISMGIIRVIMKRNSILENNMVQTIGSAGESLAAGAIFTIPALFMWAAESTEVAAPSFWNIAIISLFGGILGVLFMIPLRNALIVKEHGVLPFPEGTACAEVLLAGEEGGHKTKIVFSGLGIAALYKFITDGIKLFPSEIAWKLKSLKTGFGVDVLPALTGVGYICGLNISSYIFAGGVLGWFVLIPALSLFGLDSIIAPGTAAISEMGADGIWSSYIRYIGAGAVAAGGIFSLIKSLPLIISTFAKAMKGFGKKAESSERTRGAQHCVKLAPALAAELIKQTAEKPEIGKDHTVNEGRVPAERIKHCRHGLGEVLRKGLAFQTAAGCRQFTHGRVGLRRRGMTAV